MWPVGECFVVIVAGEALIDPGQEWNQVLSFVARAAALTCSKAGAEPPYAAELQGATGPPGGFGGPGGLGTPAPAVRRPGGPAVPADLADLGGPGSLLPARPAPGVLAVPAAPEAAFVAVRRSGGSSQPGRPGAPGSLPSRRVQRPRRLAVLSARRTGGTGSAGSRQARRPRRSGLFRHPAPAAVRRSQRRQCPGPGPCSVRRSHSSRVTCVISPQEHRLYLRPTMSVTPLSSDRAAPLCMPICPLS